MDESETPESGQSEARPYPCPECGSTKGYHRVGKFRSQCMNCNGLLQNQEIGRENQDPQ